MTNQLSLIVTDASPLITLAAAEALDCLILAKVPIVIPDMVHYEVTQDLAKLGAEQIVEWMRINRRQVEIAPTQVYAEFVSLMQLNPATKSRGRGEAAAQEVLNERFAENPDLLAILFYEDSNVRRRAFIGAVPAGVTALTTGDLLFELEAAGKIQSRDRILDAAMRADRNVEAQRNPSSQEVDRMILKQALKKGGTD